MAVAASKSPSSQVIPMPAKPRVQWSLVPNEASAPILADQIVEYFESLPGCLMVVAFVPQGPLNGDACPQDMAVAQLPGDRTNSKKPAAPIDSVREGSSGPNSGAVFVFDDVAINFAGMEARRNGNPVALRLKEFKTLTYLIQNSGRVISRDELLNEVWGYECYPCTRTVDNHILQLRRKLEAEPSRPKHFLTVHGTGYKFLP